MTDKIEYLRKLVFAEIKKCLEVDGHHKSYEGEVRIIYPNYFQEPDHFKIELSCYLIGPNRHYQWEGKSIDECCDKAIKDVEKWTRERKSYGGMI